MEGQVARSAGAHLTRGEGGVDHRPPVLRGEQPPRYPGVGGVTITTTRGIVSGFESDEKIEGLSRGWIKTDTAINPGNSGGVAVDEGFRLVGVPTRGNDRLDQLRPVNLARPLIEDAAAGDSYVQGSGVVYGTGNQSMTLVGWGTQAAEDGCLADPSATLPSSTNRIYAAFSWRGFTDGEDALWLWFRNEMPWYLSGTDVSEGWIFGESGSCLRIPGTEHDDSLLSDGSYSIVVFAGETLRRVAAETVALGGEGDRDGEGTDRRVVVTGFLEDADSGVPVVDGSIGFLAPDTDAEAWFAAETLDVEQVYSFGITDQNGQATLPDPLSIGVEYPWFMFGPETGEYFARVGCCYQLPADAVDGHEIVFPIYRATP
jgi:hypothetical protein